MHFTIQRINYKSLTRKGVVKVEAITVHSEQVTETTSGNGLRKEKLTRSLVFNLWYVDPCRSTDCI